MEISTHEGWGGGGGSFTGQWLKANHCLDVGVEHTRTLYREAKV